MKYIFTLLFLSLALFSLAQETFNRPDIPGEIMVDIGLNYWDEEPPGLEQRGFPSKHVGIYYMRRKALNNKFSFYFGLGLGMDKFSLGDSSTLLTTVDTLIVPNEIAAPGVSFNKNRLAVTYLEIPLNLRFHPAGTQDGEGFFIGVGAMVGLRLNSHSKWKYDQGDETIITKNKGSFNLNPVRFGLQGRVGFRGVHLFYKRYFSEVFDSALGNVNPTHTTVGINVTGF
ncbi:MAG: hypothetical protein AAF789_04440 [Bacteroidota bacterium]